MSIDPALFQENERNAPALDDRRYAEIGSMSLENGGFLPNVIVAYETWGQLNDAKSNAILICHAVSGDAHAIAWWSRLIGPGLPIDTDQYFVICSNALGGCQGTTGPGALAEDGQPYSLRFPAITVGDMVDAQALLLDFLGIQELHAVAGGSMGGMQALEWIRRYPQRVRKAYLTATGTAHSAMQIGFNEAARQAIIRDPKWQHGHYGEDPPVDGLSVARMIGHLSFLSDQAFQVKFGRRLQDRVDFANAFVSEFQVESYLNYQGDKFTKRFDANSFLYLSKAIDRFSCETLEGATAAYLITSYSTDWLYPSWQGQIIHDLALAAGCKSEFMEIENAMGHDAFLLDGTVQGQLLRDFLTSSSL